MQPTARLIEVGLLFNGEEEMKKGIILGLVAVLAMLILVGCTDGSVAVGDMVRLVDPDGKNIEMHEAASQNSPVMANFEPGLECEVVFEPRTVADVTFAKLSCSGGTMVEAAGGVEVFMDGWVDVTQFDVLD